MLWVCARFIALETKFLFTHDTFEAIGIEVSPSKLLR